MNDTPFLLERPGDRSITGAWHLPAQGTPVHGTVLFLHGYKGYMDWGCWDMVGNMFAHHGWRFLRINFTHNGTAPESPSTFSDLKAFAANTYRREKEEAACVIQALRARSSIQDTVVTKAPLAVIGHSRGGGIACLAAEAADKELKSAGKSGVDAIITWAAVADFASRFPKGEALEAWRSSGQLEVINHRTRQRLHHDWTFHSDFMAHQEALTIERAVRAYRGRMLIAHGTGDEAVTLDHAERLADWATDGTLHRMAGAGHTFGAREPWDEPALPADLGALTQTTLRFLEEGRAVE